MNGTVKGTLGSVMPVTSTRTYEPARGSVGIRWQSVSIPQSCAGHAPEDGRGGEQPWGGYPRSAVHTRIKVQCGVQWEGSVMTFRMVTLGTSASCFLSAHQK